MEHGAGPYWHMGKNLAVRFPGEVVKAARLRDGERVEIERAKTACRGRVWTARRVRKSAIACPSPKLPQRFTVVGDKVVILIQMLHLTGNIPEV
ncbi:MAG: hypothetical protein ACREFA_03555 [Stellaceae bacterium]